MILIIILWYFLESKCNQQDHWIIIWYNIDIKCQIPVWDEIFELEIDENIIGPKHNLFENEEGEFVCDGKCVWCDEKQPYTGKRRGPHQNRKFANRAPLDESEEMRRIKH